MHPYSGADVFPGNVSLIDDSDTPLASNFDAAPSGLADRTTWLKNRTGAFRLVGVTAGRFSDAADPATTVLQLWNAITYGPDFSVLTLSGATPTLNGDLVEVTTSGTLSEFNDNTVSTTGSIRMRANQNGGGFLNVAGARQTWVIGTTSLSLYLPFAMQSEFTVSSPGTLAIGLTGRVTVIGNGQALSLVGDLTTVIRVWRAN